MFKKSISTFILFLLTISCAYGDKVKVGMITTLSGGGSGLGIDIRDGFALAVKDETNICLLYTSPSPRDTIRSRMPSSA